MIASQSIRVWIGILPVDIQRVCSKCVGLDSSPLYIHCSTRLVVVHSLCRPFNLATLLLMRYGTLASINIMPLFFGGQTNLLADFVGVSLYAYYPMHYWAGWMMTVQGTINVSVNVYQLLNESHSGTLLKSAASQ